MSKIQQILGEKDRLQHLIGAKPVKVIAVTSGKGGVGKSSIALNLAIALAEKNKNVLLLDADLGSANIDVMLGLPSKYNLSDVIQGTCHLNDTLVQDRSGVYVIPGSSGCEHMLKLGLNEHSGIIDSFNELPHAWDYMIIDTAAGISDSVLSFARSAQEVVVVVCDEPASLTDSFALIKLMNQRYQWRQFHVLANMVGNVREGKALFKRFYRITEHFLDISLNYLGAIPFDQQVRQAIKKQRAVLTHAPDSIAALAIYQLAATVAEWPIHLTVSGHSSFFIERLIRSEMSMNRDSSM